MDEQCKQIFTNKLLNSEKKDNHLNILSREEYNIIVNDIEEGKTAAKKTALQYRRMKRFDVVEVGGAKKLVTNGERVKYFLAVEDIFDVIESVHVAVDHGGRDRMKSEISTKYANITTEMINTFLSMCEICKQKKNRKKSAVPKALINSEMYSRCQVDIIDMQSRPDHQFKFIMVYQDLTTKFLLLKPLKSKITAEVAYQLTDIFCTFGAPSILHSNSGHTFVTSVIKKLARLWSELKLIQGKPKNAKSKDAIDRSNQDIKNKIATWMTDNRSANWSTGLRYIQFARNRTVNSSIRQTPFKATFGSEPRTGLSAAMLPPNVVIKKIHDEDDLNKINAAREDHRAVPSTSKAHAKEDDETMEEDDETMEETNGKRKATDDEPEKDENGEGSASVSNPNGNSSMDIEKPILPPKKIKIAAVI